MPAVQTLDRPEVVTQILPNRLSIDESDRWGAPLAQLMRRTLAQDLTSRLPPGMFIFPDAPAPGNRGMIQWMTPNAAGIVNAAKKLMVA